MLISHHSGKREVTEVDAFVLSTAKMCVGFLYGERFATKGADYEKCPVGTCFFVASISADKAYSALYLVTARHVLTELRKSDRNIFVRLNKTVGGGVEYVPLPVEGWEAHADNQVDLVALRWWPPQEAEVTLAALPLEVLASARTYASSIDKDWPPSEGEQTFLVGLMLQHQGQERNLPILRMGHIALNTDEKIVLKGGTSQYRIIDMQTYRGNSGAPVWVQYSDGPPYCFLGILCSGFPEEAEMIGGDTYLNLGISTVVPGEMMVEHLRDLEAKRQQQREREKGNAGDVLLTAGTFTKVDMETALRKVRRRQGKKG
jgi:hypothetical protein